MPKPIDPSKIAYSDAVFQIPQSAVKITIEADIYESGEISRVRAEYNMEDIREAFHLFDETIDGEYPRYELTDKGKEWLERLLREGGNQ